MAMHLPQKLKNEIEAVGTAALYFWCWISALLLVKKLILAEYQITVNGWSVALVGALILSKVVLVLENVSLGAWVRDRPAWVEVVLRTAMYSLGVALVLILEKGFEGRHAYGGFGSAVRHLFQQVDVHHVWANTVCLSGALLGYNVLSVIRRYLGQGGLFRILSSPLPEEPEVDRQAGGV